jgi:CcmD family protein
MIMKILITMLLLIAAIPTAMAQTEMADVMRSNGKIYVVVTVLATIFAGIFAYLVFLDRRISQLEKEKKS